jgi:ABC-type Fe3+-hydroxamate transport system substrate-binding protein
MLIDNIDQITSPPTRIISLVPSQTELLSYFELDKETIGITKFCIHPEKWFREKNKIGGTKNLQLEKIISLSPNLIIANKEENVKEQIESLATKFPVWLTDVNNFEDALKMINDIGTITQKIEKSQLLIDSLKEQFQKITQTSHNSRMLYLIWKNPYMAAGGDTFINDMIVKAGFENVIKDYKRYPEISIQEMKALNCSYIFLSSEPFPFKDADIKELSEQLPSVKIIKVDGEMFSWYGSRLLKSAEYFKTLNFHLKTNF